LHVGILGNVKKKAVMCVHRFHQIDPTTISTLGAPIRKALCDSNISVMAASLNLFLDLCASKASAYKDLVPDFVSILKQVIEHRLPRDYDYHRMPAPWVQLKLLQILAVLGASDKNASEGMYEILREVMKRADIGINVGYAIVYECVRTVTSIYPDPALIEDAASSISRFITSDNHNLKYLGVNALAAIVQIDSKYAAEHQLVVIDCLEDPDETLKRKTLDLLYSMTNPQNVTVIVSKLTQYLQSATDQYLRAELVSRINQLAEKYAPSNQWFITTMSV
jgi:AP-4 complex subunit epsilon-1